MKEKRVHVHSIGIFGVITAVLAALKLAGLADYSWLFVIASLLLSIAVQIAILLIVLLWIKWDDWRGYKR